MLVDMPGKCAKGNLFNPARLRWNAEALQKFCTMQEEQSEGGGRFMLCARDSRAVQELRNRKVLAAEDLAGALKMTNHGTKLLEPAPRPAVQVAHFNTQRVTC